MKNKYIGITLVFVLKEKKLYKAIKTSFIFLYKDWNDLNREIEIISSNLIKNEFKGYKFYGISDIYITDKEGEGQYLGRTSFFKDKKFQDAKKYIYKSEDKLQKALNNAQSYDKINISFVYFHQDKEGSEYNSTIIIYSQIAKNRNIKYIYKLAKSISFKKKIIDFSVEQLYISSLQFVGIMALYGIKKRGLFSQYAEFEDINEIKADLLNETEIYILLNEINEDYKYVNLVSSSS